MWNVVRRFFLLIILDQQHSWLAQSVICDDMTGKAVSQDTSRHYTKLKKAKATQRDSPQSMCKFLQGMPGERAHNGMIGINWMTEHTLESVVFDESL